LQAFTSFFKSAPRFTRSPCFQATRSTCRGSLRPTSKSSARSCSPGVQFMNLHFGRKVFGQFSG
jgi:hypothetical protein